jgi:hypothetical protein
MKKLVVVLLAVALVGIAAPAMAKTILDLDGLVSQDEFKKLSTDIGLAISYMPLAPAEPLGNKLPGFDIGIEATSVNIDRGESYWQNAGVDIPSSLVFPKLHAQVGLPFIPIDIGAVYAKVPDSDIEYWGAELKWAIIRGGTVTPAVAIRGAYTKLQGVDVLDIDTKSLDLSISKGFTILTPYAGVGGVWITSKDTDPDTNFKDEDITEVKGFVGLKITFFPFMNFVAEADFATVNAYSARLNLHF